MYFSYGLCGVSIKTQIISFWRDISFFHSISVGVCWTRAHSFIRMTHHTKSYFCWIFCKIPFIMVSATVFKILKDCYFERWIDATNANWRINVFVYFRPVQYTCSTSSFSSERCNLCFDFQTNIAVVSLILFQSIRNDKISHENVCINWDAIVVVFVIAVLVYMLSTILFYYFKQLLWYKN